jgi:predicted amidohydrolase
MPHISVAVVQAEVAPTLAAGLELTRTLTLEAAAHGARLVVFPETWLPGYPAWLDVCRDVALWNHAPTKAAFARYRTESVDLAGADGAALSKIAADAQVTLVLGVSERVASGPGFGTLFNTLVTYGPDGRLFNHHRKLVPTYTERMIWGGGDTAGLRAVDTSAGRISGLICWEHWMPLARQALHDSGEDLHVAVWPTVHDNHQLASRHYAFEGRCFVLAAGSLMRASALPPDLDLDPVRAPNAAYFVLRGGSAIIGPDGAYIVAPQFEVATMLYATLDTIQLDAERMTLDVAGHYARPDGFEFSVRPARRSLEPRTASREPHRD